jgi:hypothetical protein
LKSFSVKHWRQTQALETNMNHVKRTVFGVTDGASILAEDVTDSAPILAEDHPVYTAMAKIMKGARSILKFIQIMCP